MVLTGTTIRSDFQAAFPTLIPRTVKSGNLHRNPEVSMGTVSVWGEEKVLEPDSGDGCKTV